MPPSQPPHPKPPHLVSDQSPSPHSQPYDGSTADGFVVFITRVDKDSMAEQANLKLGDRLISINGTSTRSFGLVRALQLISASDRLELVVAFDPAGFEQMVR